MTTPTETPICPKCGYSDYMIWHKDTNEWVCHSTHILDEPADTPRTDACPHCGAGITTIKNHLGHAEYGCGNWSDCVSQSELCRERSARQKAEAEVEELKASITRQYWQEKMQIAEAEVERLMEELEKERATIGNWRMEACRAEKAEARVDHYCDLINKADDKVLKLEAEVERLQANLRRVVEIADGISIHAGWNHNKTQELIAELEQLKATLNQTDK